MALEAIVLSQLDPFLGIGNSSTTAAAGSSMLNHYYDLLGTTTGSSTPSFLDPFNKFPVSSSSTSFCYGGVYDNETTNRCIHNINSVASNTVGSSSSSSCCSTATAINNNYYHESLIISSSSPVGNNLNVCGGGGGGTSTTTTTHDHVWDHLQLYGPSITSHNYVYSSSSSPPNHNHAGGGCTSVALVDHPSSQGHCCCCCCRDNDQEVVIVTPPPPTTTVLSSGRVFGKMRKRRRRCTTKNKEEVENQRMTHIAVERNRRKQMNDYLSVIRSLMPSSYVQRGDQASIVGGAINYVKELEQLLQSLESQKRKLPATPQHQQPADDNYQSKTNIITDDAAKNTSPFSNFFSFPQYSKSKHGSTFSPTSLSSSLSSDHDNINNNYNYQETVNVTAAPAAEGEIEVTTAENHANVKILSKKQPRQLLKLVAGFQSLRLSVLHLNVTSTHDHFILYSFSLKVEEGCGLTSVDEIASAANHILGS